MTSERERQIEAALREAQRLLADLTGGDIKQSITPNGQELSAEIREESTNLAMDRIATVRAERGDEFVINLDAAAKALANLFSEYDNERRFGWTLETGWYAQEFKRLRQASLAVTTPDGSVPHG